MTTNRPDLVQLSVGPKEIKLYIETSSISSGASTLVTALETAPIKNGLYCLSLPEEDPEVRSGS
jgi:hypothetical protein